MMNYIKRLGVGAYVALASIILEIIGLIIYSVNSTTGQMAGGSVSAAVVIFSILPIICILGAVFFDDKLNHYITSVIYLAAAIFTMLAICFFIMEREEVAANQWFIPGLDTEAQEACLSQAIVGVVFYGLSLVATFVTGFLGNHILKKAE